MNKKQGKMIAVVGPTATGKSDLAISIAKKFGGEIISCDSMQIYRGMNIGTAKPTKEEMLQVKHHLIDVVDLGREYSVSDYVKDATVCTENLFSRNVLPVFCGGTGLYISSFLSGIEFSDYENNPLVRQKLEETLRMQGIDTLYQRLVEVDPEIASTIEKNNEKRVVRALEVFENTGVTMTEWNKRSRENAVEKDCFIIGLDYSDRQMLYDRIDLRVDKMMQSGLLEETKDLLESGLLDTKTARQAIAYKEFLPYFNGESTLEECVEILKRNSRRYAKRQLTWFKRNKKINWISRDCLSNEETFQRVVPLIEEYLAEEVNG